MSRNREAKRAVNNFLCLGVRCVIITLGALGAVFASNEDPKPVHVRTPRCERVIDTTVSLMVLSADATQNWDIFCSEKLKHFLD